MFFSVWWWSKGKLEERCRGIFLTWRAVAAPPLVRIRVNPSSAASRADACVVIVKMIKMEMITILITVVVMISDHDDHDQLVSISSWLALISRVRSIALCKVRSRPGCFALAENHIYEDCLDHNGNGDEYKMARTVLAISHLAALIRLLRRAVSRSPFTVKQPNTRPWRFQVSSSIIYY